MEILIFIKKYSFFNSLTVFTTYKPSNMKMPSQLHRTLCVQPHPKRVHGQTLAVPLKPFQGKARRHEACLNRLSIADSTGTP
jgi:hypothetical protein